MKINTSLLTFIYNIPPISGLFIFLSWFPCDFLIYSQSLPLISIFPFGIFVTFLTFLAMITFIRGNSIKCNKPLIFWLLILIFLSFILLAFIRVVLDSNVDNIDIILVCYYLFYTIAGYLFGKSLQFFNFKLIFIASFILLVISILYATDFNSFSYLLLNDDDLNYLRLAESFVLCSFGVISYCHSQPFVILSFLLSILSLFLINSRFSLFCYLFLGLLVIIYRFRKKGVLLLTVFILLLLLFGNSIVENEIFMNSRIGYLVFNTSEDGSLITRINQINSGINAIRNNWFIGDLRGQVLYGGSYGSYIHNILSYWRQYGLIPFLLFSFTLILTWFYYFYILKFNNNRSLLILVFIYLVYTTTGVLFAKSFVYTHIYYSIGIVFSLSKSNKITQKCTVNL